MVAEKAAERKVAKYSAFTSIYHFVPIGFETLGPASASALCFIRELGRRLNVVTGDIRQSSFLFQRLSVIVQNFNAVAFRYSFCAGVDEDFELGHP